MARYEIEITRKPLDDATSPRFPIVSMSIRIAAPNDEVAEDIAEDIVGHIHNAFGITYGPNGPLIVDSVTEMA